MALQGRHCRETANKGKKYTSKPELLLEPEGKKNKMKDKKTLYFDRLLPFIRHLFRHKISTMMETSNAILKHVI